MMLTLPVVYPVMMSLGYDPVWFGIVMVILLEIGLITPPVGINLYVIQGLTQKPLSLVALGSLPYVILMLGMVVLISIFPDIVLWLPRKMM